MSKLPQDWEKMLQEKPFAGSRFSKQLQQKVHDRLPGPLPRKLRARTYAALVLPLLVLVLLIGYSAGGFSSTPSSSGITGAAAPGGGPDKVTPVNGAGNSPDDAAADSLPAMLSFPSADSAGEKVQLPLRAIPALPSAENGLPAVKNPIPALPEMTFPLTGRVADQLQATLVYRTDAQDSYVLLAPAGWEASAVIGVNGSYGVTYRNPADPAQTLIYTDTNWSCQGCAIGDIGLYFPDKEEWAADQGFPVYVPLEFTKRQLGSTGDAAARTLRYALEPDTESLAADGAAYYEEGSWGYLIRRLELKHASGGSGQEAMESIMGFFAANQGALRLVEPEADSTAADAVPFPASALTGALEQQGLQLAAVNAGEEHMFNKELAGVWPDELLIDYEGPLTITDRLSIYTYDGAEACADGLEALKLEINRTTYDGGARTYPHVFRGGNFLVVYWMGPGGDGGFKYDKAIKTALAGFSSKE
ncbi:hypothetical protein D3C75_275340 [compost metagenome]